MGRIVTIIIISTVLMAVSCDSNTKDTQGQLNRVGIEKTDSVAPVKVIFSFLKWYNDNHLNLTDNLVLNSWGSEKWDSTKYYAVNFPETEKYLSTLKSTGFISETYISQWRNYFKKCEEEFIKNPEKDGPPSGFDYDFIFHSQMSPYYSNLKQDEDSLTQSSVISKRIQNSKAKITIVFPSKDKYEFQLTLVNDNWLIDDIQPN